MRRSFLGCLVSSLLGLSCATATLAAGPVSTPSVTTLTDLIAGWKATGVQVTGGTVTPLPGTDRIEVRDLTLTFPVQPPATRQPAVPLVSTSLVIGRIEASGVTRTARGYGARAFAASNIKLAGPTGTVSLASLTLDQVDLPTQDWPAAVVGMPAASLAALVKALNRVGVAQGVATDLKVTPPGIDATALAVEKLSVGGIASGRLERLDIGHIMATTGANTGLEVDGVTVEALDLAAVGRVFDSASYRPFPPELLWTPVAAKLALGAITQRSTGQTVSLAGATLEGLQIRPFRSDIPTQIDAVSSAPGQVQPGSPEMMALMAELTDMLRLERGAVDKFVLEAPDRAVSRLACDGAAIDGVTLRSVEALTIRQCAVEGKDAPPISFGELALRRLSADRMIMTRLTDPAASDVAPTLSQARLSDLAVNGPNGVRLGRLVVDMDAPVRGIPTQIAVAMDGLRAPVAGIANPIARGVMQDLGLETFNAGLAVRAGWRETSQEVEIEELGLTVEQLGRLNVSATIGNVPRRVFEDPATAAALANNAALRRVKLSFDDASFAERALNRLAAANKISPEEMRGGLSRAVPHVLSTVPDASARARLTFALLSFVNTPGYLDISSGILEPVALSKVLETARTSLLLLPGLLKLDAVAGKSRPNKAG